MKKRQWMDKNIWRLPDGRFEVCVDLSKKSPDGKRLGRPVREYCGSISEARKARDRMRAQLNARAAGPEAPRTLGDVAEIFLLRWKSLGPRSRAAMTNTLDRAVALLGGPTRKLTTISESDIEQVGATVLRTRGAHGVNLSPKTARETVKIINRLLREAWDRRWIDYAPKWSQPAPRTRRELPIGLPEFKLMCEQLSQPYRGMAWVMLYSGMRISDTLATSWSHIRTINGQTWLMARSGKTHKEDIPIPVPASLARQLPERNPKSPLMFYSERTNAALGQMAVRNRFRAACISAAIPVITPHHIRHLAATLLNQISGGDTSAVIQYMGHTTIQSGRHYDHAMPRAQSLGFKLDRFVNGNDESPEGTVVAKIAEFIGLNQDPVSTLDAIQALIISHKNHKGGNEVVNFQPLK